MEKPGFTRIAKVILPVKIRYIRALFENAFKKIKAIPFNSVIVAGELSKPCTFCIRTLKPINVKMLQINWPQGMDSKAMIELPKVVKSIPK